MKRAEEHQWYVDIETHNWVEPICAVAISDAGDVERFTGLGAICELSDLQERTGGTFWAHGGGIFDHLLTWRARGRLPAEVILSGSAVLKARAEKNPRVRRALWFRDSQPRWLAPLVKVGKAIGLEKLDVGDRGDLLKNLPLDEIVRYCERDAEILRRGSMLEDAWLAQWDVTAHTSGTAAVKLLEALDPDCWAEMMHPANLVAERVAIGKMKIDDDEAEDDDYEDGALDAVRGGRTETRHIGEVSDVYVYDIHSSYPSQYHGRRVPIGCVPTTSRKLSDWGWVDWCSWDSRPNEDGRTAFELGEDGSGHGRLEGYLWCEIAHALAERDCNVKRHGVGWKCTAVLDGFARNFVDELYRIKELTGPQQFFAKVTLNSLHGKFGESPLRERYKLKEDRPPFEPRTPILDYYDCKTYLHGQQPHQQPLLAACVLGRARLQLAEAIEALEDNGWQFYYCDTDSLHTNCPPVEMKKILPIGNALGQWGIEAERRRGIYLAPKTYWLDDGNNAHNAKSAKVRRAEKLDVKMAAKGMPRDEMMADHFLNAAMLDEDDEGHPLTREGVRRFKQGGDFGTRSALTRRLRPVTNGRKRLENGRLIYT